MVDFRGVGGVAHSGDNELIIVHDRVGLEKGTLVVGDMDNYVAEGEMGHFDNLPHFLTVEWTESTLSSDLDDIRAWQYVL